MLEHLLIFEIGQCWGVHGLHAIYRLKMVFASNHCHAGIGVLHKVPKTLCHYFIRKIHLFCVCYGHAKVLTMIFRH